MLDVAARCRSLKGPKGHAKEISFHEIIEIRVLQALSLYLQRTKMTMRGRADSNVRIIRGTYWYWYGICRRSYFQLNMLRLQGQDR